MIDKYLVEVVGHDKKRVLWEVVDDHVVEEPSDQKDIGLQGWGLVREGCSEPYLLMLIKLWPGDWISQLKRIN